MFKLFLYHGRKSPDEELEDWGKDGPTMKGVVGVYQTYNSTLRITFATEELAEIAR